MTFRQWYLGIAAVAAAALIPLSANALVVPNLLNGGGALDTAAGPGDPMIAHFDGVTAETAAVGVNPDSTVATPLAAVNNGSCNAAGTLCGETTWGLGVVTQVLDSNTGNPSWNNGDKSGGATGESIAFVLYGIADKSVAFSNSGANQTQQIDNVGATTSTFGTTDGLIHLDLYYLDSSKKPCFVAGCSSATSVEVDASARGAGSNTAGGVAQVTGITNVGTLFAAFVLQPGTSADSAVTLSQSITVNATTGKSTGAGNNANFYGDCAIASTPGPGCPQFAPVQEQDTVGASAFDPTLLTQIFGQINTATLNALSGNAGNASSLTTFTLDGSNNPIGVIHSGSSNNVGYLIKTTDPVNFNAPIPEPASLGLLGAALAFFGAAVRRRRKGMSA